MFFKYFFIYKDSSEDNLDFDRESMGVDNFFTIFAYLKIYLENKGFCVIMEKYDRRKTPKAL